MWLERAAEGGPVVTFHLGLIYFLGARMLSRPEPVYWKKKKTKKVTIFYLGSSFTDLVLQDISYERSYA